MKPSVLRHSLLVATALASLLLLAGCGSSRITEAWSDPTVTKISYQRLFVSVTGTDATTRAAFENAIGAALPAAHVVAGNTVLPATAAPELLAAAVAQSKCDGFALVHVASDRVVKGSLPGEPVKTGYPSTTDAYANAAPQFTTPEIPTSNRVLTITVALYETASDKLQWRCVIESINPSSNADLGTEIAKTVAAKLRSQGLVK